MRYTHGVTHNLTGILALILILIAPVGIAFAEKTPKTYPLEGKIVATGLDEYSINGSKRFTHTYTVVTDTKLYLLDCGKRSFFGSTGEECGGAKKLQIGDVIHFRVEKGTAYIPITEALSPVGPAKQSEQKLRILSEELKPEKTDKP